MENSRPLPRPRTQPYYSVERPVLTHEQYVQKSEYVQPASGCLAWLRRCCARCSLSEFFLSIVPILKWLPKYKVLSDFPADIAAGFTVAIMNIPHGIAYGLLAGLPPQCGLYMAVFPVLVYVLLGTSRHISMGTFSIASMMTFKVINTYVSGVDRELATGPKENSTSTYQKANSTDVDSETGPIQTTALDVATALAMAAGIVHIAMWLLRLGVLASLLSEQLVSGFLTGCAFHVAGNQLRDYFGVIVPSHKGLLKLPLNVMEVMKALPKSNPATVIISTIVTAFLILCNECVKPFLKRYCRFPFPSELLAIVGGTIFASIEHTAERYKVINVGAIPTGLPLPKLPGFQMVLKVILDSVPIAVVTYSTVMSLGLSFAKRYHYQVHANQELLALGAGNMMASLFMGFPLAASLSRSALQAQTGGKTQMASVMSAMLIILVLLWCGKFFSDLPRCVLAAVIIVALKSMFWQLLDVKTFAAEGKLEMWTWILTFLTVVLVDIDIGLYVGICLSMLALWMNGFRTSSLLLGITEAVPAVYVNLLNHENAVEPPNTKIYRYSGSLNFATRLFFRNQLASALNNNQYRKPSGKLLTINSYLVLVVDLSMVGHMDISGCRALFDLSQELNERGVRVLLACPSDNVYDTLQRAMHLGYGPFDIFPSLHDCVEYAKLCR